MNPLLFRYFIAKMNTSCDVRLLLYRCLFAVFFFFLFSPPSALAENGLQIIFSGNVKGEINPCG